MCGGTRCFVLFAVQELSLREYLLCHLCHSSLKNIQNQLLQKNLEARGTDTQPFV